MLDSVLGAMPAVRRLQSRGAGLLFRIGLQPDTATIIAGITGVLSGIAFARQEIFLGVGLLALSAALDALDGTIAREYARPGPFGGVLDLCSDRVVETAVIIGIAWPYPMLYFPALLLVGSWYINITVFLAVGAAIERRGPKLIDYPPGLLERTEALIFFVFLAILGPSGAFLWYLMTALEIVTGAQRLLFGRRTLRDERDGNS